MTMNPPLSALILLSNYNLVCAQIIKHKENLPADKKNTKKKQINGY